MCYAIDNRELDFIEYDEAGRKLIIRQYASNLAGETIFEEIELTGLEDLEYLRDNLNKFISKWKAEHATHEDREEAPNSMQEDTERHQIKEIF